MGKIRISLALAVLIMLASLSGVNGQYQVTYQQPYTTSTASAMATDSTAQTYDFTGVVFRVSEPNALYVNVTKSSTIALGKTEVLLNQPLPDLSYFNGKELQFNIIGHDILKRPVCDVYFNGRTIQDAYYCMKYPSTCAYYGQYFNNQLLGTEAYSRPYYFWPYYGPYRYVSPYWYGSGYYWDNGYY
ncbi:MAG: hypothetical protein A4E48_02492 [Methanosaeta sp. PtaU1.Bin060]|jgi:hypothetical protein|nr:MAG: hypothetical protein A4E48_02492 [Methanosaeta sp. PtaU1.Bin060]